VSCFQRGKRHQHAYLMKAELSIIWLRYTPSATCTVSSWPTCYQAMDTTPLPNQSELTALPCASDVTTRRPLGNIFLRLVTIPCNAGAPVVLRCTVHTIASHEEKLASPALTNAPKRIYPARTGLGSWPRQASRRHVHTSHHKRRGSAGLERI
jgi:hypothetical protein